MTPKEAATQVIKTLNDNGFNGFLVGGCVRDIVLGREPKDFDVTTNARPEQVEKLFEKTIPVGASFGVIVVMLEGIQIEVATFRSDGVYSDARRPDIVFYTDNVEQDVERRDFTINGLLSTGAIDDSENPSRIFISSKGANSVKFTDDNDGMTYGILDYVGGFEDIKAKRIRGIGNPDARFREDALRMLRAVRFAAQLGFEIEPETFRAIRINAHSITRVSKERIAVELFKLVSSPYPVKGLVPLFTSGLAQHVFGNGFMEEAALGWTLFRFAEYSAQVKNNPLLGMAMLFADASLEAVEDFCLQHKLSNEQTDIITGAVRYKSDVINVFDRLFTLGEMKRLSRKKGVLEAVELVEQDIFMGRTSMDVREWAPVAERFRTFTHEDLYPKMLVTGDDLIAMGEKPSPVFTRVLGQLERAQMDGVIKDREDALVYVRSLLSQGVGK